MSDQVIGRSFVTLEPAPGTIQSFGKQVQQGIKGQLTRATSAISGAAKQQAASAKQSADAQVSQQRRVAEESGRSAKQSSKHWDGANKQMERASTFATARISKRFGGMTASVGQAFHGLGASVGLALGGLALVGFIKSSISAASDLNETVSKTGVIFGEQALPGLEKFAEAAVKGLGQSKQSALDAAATFGVFGKSAGLSGQNLVGFSTKLVTLSSDMASFSNTSPEEAITAIGAALRGETEPIRRYGVLIDDASTRQQALKLGLIKTTKEALTPQQRVLAVQALIFKQTAAAQGDFARTSGGLANQQRILSAQMEETKVSIGTALLPIVIKLFGFFNNTAIPAIQKVGLGFTALKAAFSGEGITSDGFVGVMERIGVAASYVKTAIQAIFDTAKNGAGSGFLDAFGPRTASALTNVGLAIRVVVNVLSEMVKWVSQNKAVLAGFVITLTAGFLAFKAFLIVQRVITFIRGLTISWAALNAVMAANVVGIVIVALALLVAGIIYAYKHSAKFRDILATTWAVIRKAAEIAAPLIKAAIGVVVGAFQLWWMIVKPIAERYIAILKLMWQTTQFMAKLVIAAFNALKGPIFSVLVFLTKIFLNWAGALITGAAKALGWVPGLGPKLKKAAGAFNTFKDQTNAALSKLKDQEINVTPKLKNVVATVGGITRTVPLNSIGSFGRAATGGPIHGPGTTTSDSIPTMLSNQEHVLSAREVQGMGGHGAVSRMRDAARSGQFGFANGGTTAVRLAAHTPSGRGTGVWASEIAAHAVAAARPAAIAAATGLANQMAAAAQSAGAWTGGGDLVPHSFRGKLLNGRTIQMLLAAEKILGSVFHIAQGSYHHGVKASFGTHDGGGVMDTNEAGRGWTRAVNALRHVGFAAWHRTPAQGFPHHIHSVALGDPTASPSAKNQMAAFKRGGDGLGHGMASGAWKILRDQITKVHKGEMVVPADEAEELRQLYSGRGRAQRPPSGQGGGGYQRLHPDDIEALADAVAQRPTMLNGTRLDYAMSNEATRRYR